MLADLGKIRAVWRGDYDPEATYTELDQVHFAGSAYIFIGKEAAKGVAPVSGQSSQFWDLVARGASIPALATANVIFPIAYAPRLERHLHVFDLNIRPASRHSTIILNYTITHKRVPGMAFLVKANGNPINQPSFLADRSGGWSPANGAGVSMANSSLTIPVQPGNTNPLTYSLHCRFMDPQSFWINRDVTAQDHYTQLQGLSVATAFEIIR